MSKSNVALLTPSDRASDGRHLGPADVLAVNGRDLEVRLESQEVVTATLALPVPYEAQVGDVVLVVGQGTRSYVIGVILGQAPMVLSFDGDVQVRSNDGVLRLSGARGVEIDGPGVDLKADTLTVTATAVVQRVVSFTQRVRDLLSVHVGRRHETVDGASLTHSKSTTFVTQDDVKINGKTIQLG